MRPAKIVVVLAIGLLGIGPLAGCGRDPEGTEPEAPVTPTTGNAPPLPLPQPQPPEGPLRPEPGLDAEDRAMLAQAKRLAAPWVVLRVATEPARTDEAAAGLEGLGGVLSTVQPAPDQLRVTMPTAEVARAAALPAVTALDVEQVIPPGSARPHHP